MEEITRFVMLARSADKDVIRVSVQAGLQPDIATAINALRQLKASSPVKVELWPDGLGVDRLPGNIRKPSDITDAHLLELARSHRAQLITLDSGITGATLIP